MQSRPASSDPGHRKHAVLLIDDESLLRDALRALVNEQQDYMALGAACGAQLGDLALAADPEIVMMEFALHDGRGSEVVRVVRERWPQARILVLTHRRDDTQIEAALRAGVDGYLLKSDSVIELGHALSAVLDGTRYISPAIFERVVNGYVRRDGHAERPGDGLSERERAVMRRIGQGLRTREIAAQLSLSYKTIEKHRSTLMRKLGLRTATAVAAYAIAHGYLQDGAD